MESPPQAVADEDRRRCRRLPVVDEGNRISLRKGRKVWPAACMDQSAEGFGVLCVDFPWSQGQELVLKKAEHLFDVKVMYVREYEWGQQVGLRRLRDHDDHRSRATWWLIWNGLSEWLLILFKPQLLGLCGAFLVCSLVLLLAVRPEMLESTGRRWLGRQTGSHDAGSNLGSLELADLLSRPTKDQRVGRGRGSAKLTWKRVERALELSGEQSAKLLSLVHGGSPQGPVDQPDGREVYIERHRDFAEYLEALPEANLDFLTPQQHRRLDAMVEILRGK